LALRITRFDGDEGTLLQIDGRLGVEGLGEFERARAGVRLPLSLDLRGVSWLDERARETLRRCVAEGAKVRAAPPFIALLLATEPPTANQEPLG